MVFLSLDPGRYEASSHYSNNQMKAALVLAVSAAMASGYTIEEFESFVGFKSQFNKVYETVEEETTRFTHFMASMERAKKANLAGGVNSFGPTKFSDMSAEEFKARYLTYTPMDKETRAAHVAATPVFQGNTTVAAAPKSFDWRDHGAVTAVKDQGQCGSCWAFSTTQQIESQWFLAGNDLVEFAPQQLVSCDHNDGGCNGGDTTKAYSYVEKVGGMVKEKSFPYKSGHSGSNGECMSNIEESIAGGDISGFTYATPSCNYGCYNQDEEIMAANLASTAPASICVDAEPWQDYHGGLFPAQGSSCHSAYYELDHCVQVVGYNKDPSSQGKPYWIVRNSWSADWGEDGYIYIEMGDNLCGIADEATFVTIAE